MLTQIRSAASGAQTAAEAEAAVAAWFDDPAGGFATAGYLGDTGAPPRRRIYETTVVDITARADAPALRDVMKAAAMASLASGGTPPLDRLERARLLQASGRQAASAAQPMATLQAGLGMAEASVADTRAALSARKTYITTARNDMVSADPFETATNLQAVQTALETHFTVIARLSHLRLSEYLR
ncbi:flagellin [Limimaricola sp.]|uniref:flagellin n=1 Tax=Limimaricola sp. TaxID=2211665 RepID=UPI0025B8D5CD|nr:flagellin [Limimaricola sp.]